MCRDSLPTHSMAINYSSSGSDHEPSSVCLAAMVHEFMESDAGSGACGRARCNCLNGNCGREACSGSDSEDSKSSLGGELSEILQGLVSLASNRERRLTADVTKAMRFITGEATSICRYEGRNCSDRCLRRALMKELRGAGCNAAICKSRWDHTGGYPAGDYAYIDVIFEGTIGKNERLIVDTDFRAQFDIARPTDRYVSFLRNLPQIFVGKPERLQQIVKFMSDAAKQSLKKTGLHLPPWRKPDYMQAKWFSPYKRTTNDVIHPHSEGPRGNGFAGIAVRRSGLDARDAKELETYHEAVAIGAMEAMNTLGDDANQKGRGKRLGRDVLEGVLEGGSGNANRFAGEKGEITVMSTDWQPPPVNPRASQKPTRVAGLASVLMQAGLTASLARPRNAKQEERLAIAA